MRFVAGVCVALAAWPAASPSGAGAVTRVSGIVFDSVGRMPLSGAHVQFLPLDPALQESGRRSADSDSTGTYAVPDLEPGRYLVGFFHPKLDSLGLEPSVHRVDVRGGHEQALDLAVPSPATIISSWCGAAAGRDSSGVILGFVRDAASASTLVNATVAARWSAITIGQRGARAEVQETHTQTNASGWFGLCGVPRGAVLVMRASTPSDSSALLELDVPEHGLLVRDISMDPGRAGAAEPAAVTGLVHDLSGQPLVGARVRLWGTEVETRSGEDGSFRLGAPRAGTQLIDARLIGFVPLRRVVDVLPGTGAIVELTMAEFPTEIDTVRVLTAAAARRDVLAGFEHRRRLGYGFFLDPEQVERRRPLVFTDLLRGLSGVDVRSVDMMTRTVQMHGINGAACFPALVVDGLRLSIPEVNLDDVIPAELVRAIEVYPRRIQAPPEYQTVDCGSIVVWTGLRGWLAKRLNNRTP